MKAKQIILTPLVALILTGCDGKTNSPASESLKDFSPVAPHRVGSLEPEDIGIYKFVFEATPPAGKVMVLRWTRIVPGQKTEVRDTIHVNTYMPVREVVLVYNSRLFPFNADPGKPSLILVKARGEERRLPPGTACTVGQIGDELALLFSNNERWNYKCFIEDYKTVKARIPDLPAAPTNGGWSFNSEVLPN